MAFALVKEMQADGLEWGEGYRPLGREALAEIIQGQMAEAVALANRMARIVWALTVNKEVYRAPAAA